MKRLAGRTQDLADLDFSRDADMAPGAVQRRLDELRGLVELAAFLHQASVPRSG